MFEPRFSRQFARASRKVDRAALKAACDEIIAAPYTARGSHLLRHHWAGFRSANFDGRFRIIYRVCDECVNCNHRALSPLPCCSDEARDPHVITFVDFGDYHAGNRRLRPSASYDLPEDE